MISGMNSNFLSNGSRGRKKPTSIINGIPMNWQNTKITYSQGSDIMDTGHRLGPIFDSDADGLLYRQDNDLYRRYSAYLENTVGKLQNINGVTKMWGTNPTPAPQITTGTERARKLSPDEPIDPPPGTGETPKGMVTAFPKKENFENNEELFINNPLTLFDMSKINLSATDNITRINSLARIIILIGSATVLYTSRTQISSLLIVLAVIIALIISNTFKGITDTAESSKENFDVVNGMDLNPHSRFKYQPLDLYTSKTMNERLVSGIPYAYARNKSALYKSMLNPPTRIYKRGD